MTSASPTATRASPRRSASYLSQALRRLRADRGALIGLGLMLSIIVVALIAPWIAPYDPLATHPALRFRAPSAEFWLGNDELGRDILSRILYGARISLLVGVLSVSIGLLVGGSLGLVAGYYRFLDNPIMRLIDILMAFPFVLRAIAIVAILGPGLLNTIIAVGFGGIPAFARLLRSSVLSLRETPYVESARSLGASDLRIMFSHILPNAMGPVIVYATLTMATSVLAASILSFLGLGVQPPTPEWGDMVSQGRLYLRIAPHIVIFPSIAISLVVLGFNLLGDGLRDALDPSLRRLARGRGLA